jgi:hypothetical protein
VDEGQVAYLYECLLDAAPAQVAVIRAALLDHKDALTEKLWAVVEQPRKEQDGQRLRAAAALAKFDPDSPRWEKNGAAVAADVVAVPAVYLANWLEALKPVRDKLVAPLSGIFRDTGRRETERSLATDLLADYAADRPEELGKLLMDADEKQFAVLFPKLEAQRVAVLPLLGETVKTRLETKKNEEEKERLAKRQANAAVALLRLGEPARVWPLLEHRSDPRTRSYLIHRLAPLGAEPAALIGQLSDEKEVSIRRALLLGLGEFGPSRLPAAQGQALLARVWQMYREEPDAGLHGAAEWLLRQWKQDDKLKEYQQEWRKGPREARAAAAAAKSEPGRGSARCQSAPDGRQVVHQRPGPDDGRHSRSGDVSHGFATERGRPRGWPQGQNRDAAPEAHRPDVCHRRSRGDGGAVPALP